MLKRNGLAKNILQDDIIYYFKYREFTIFTVDDHISDNSLQINIRFTFTVYEFIIVYKYIVLSIFIYIYIYIIIFNYIYLIIVTSRNGLPNCEQDPSYNEGARAT